MRRIYNPFPGIFTICLRIYCRAAPAQNDHRDLRPVEQAKVHVCIAKPAADIQGRFALPVKPGIPYGEQPPVVGMDLAFYALGTVTGGRQGACYAGGADDLQYA